MSALAATERRGSGEVNLVRAAHLPVQQGQTSVPFVFKVARFNKKSVWSWSR